MVAPDKYLIIGLKQLQAEARHSPQRAHKGYYLDEFIGNLSPVHDHRKRAQLHTIVSKLL